MSYRWILFDIDGTLFDFDRAEKISLERTFGQFGHSFESQIPSLYHRINGHLWREFEAGAVSAEGIKSKRFELLFQELGLVEDANRFGVSYLANLADCPHLLDGAEDVVRSLEGIASLMLITNGLKDVQRPRLAKSALNGSFADIVISEEVGVAKPAPQIFEEAFRLMGQPAKSEVVIIGDSLSSDIKGGLNFGIDTCWYNAKQYAADPEIVSHYEIQHLSEVRGVLGLE